MDNRTREEIPYAVPLSKRGNSVYVKRTLRRFTNFCQKIPNVQYFKPHEPVKTTKVLFFTLTYDTKICPYQTAWENIGKEFNKFMANMRNKYGEIGVIRCWEAFGNGHPHIHALLNFKEQDFEVVGKHNDNGEFYWGIKKEVTMDENWHSKQNIMAMTDLGGALRYLTKYITKSIDFKDASPKTHQTLALMWLNNKRSFSISNPLAFGVPVLIQDMRNSKLKEKQLTLDGGCFDIEPRFKWEFIGIVQENTINPTEKQETSSFYRLEPEQYEVAVKIINREVEVESQLPAATSEELEAQCLYDLNPKLPKMWFQVGSP